MATYTIQSEGNHIVPYTLLVTIPINITATYVQGAETTATGEEFTALFNTHCANTENYYKTIPEFTVQDETRNVVWSSDNLGLAPDGSGKTLYQIIMTFTITNATAQSTITVQSDLTGEALSAFLQTSADNEAINFKYGRNWVDL